MLTNRSNSAFFLATVIYLLIACFARSAAADEQPETARTWWQATRGYYDASDGWETYKTCRTKMDQPLKYSDYDFKRLSIPEIDTLAREAKSKYDLYQRYSTAIDQVDLKKLSAKDFSCLTDEKEAALMAEAEDTAQKWPTYKTNMARMGPAIQLGRRVPSAICRQAKRVAERLSGN